MRWWEEGGKGDRKGGGVAEVASSMSAGAGSPETRSLTSSLLRSATSAGAVSRVATSESMLMSTPEPPVLGQGFMTCADVRRHGQ